MQDDGCLLSYRAEQVPTLKLSIDTQREAHSRPTLPLVTPRMHAVSRLVTIQTTDRTKYVVAYCFYLACIIN